MRRSMNHIVIRPGVLDFTAARMAARAPRLMRKAAAIVAHEAELERRINNRAVLRSFGEHPGMGPAA